MAAALPQRAAESGFRANVLEESQLRASPVSRANKAACRPTVAPNRAAEGRSADKNTANICREKCKCRRPRQSFQA